VGQACAISFGPAREACTINYRPAPEACAINHGRLRNSPFPWFSFTYKKTVAHMGDMNAGLRSQGASVEFLWNGLYPGSGERGNYKLKTNYNENREGLYMEARLAFVFKIVASRLGILLVDAIA
jgi:hypothetical protein